MATQEVMKQGGKRKIGDRCDTKVWKISWLPCQQNGYLTSEGIQELEYITVHELLRDNNKEWDFGYFTRFI